MSNLFFKKIADSFDSIAFGSGIFVSVVLACSQSTKLTPAVQPNPSPIPLTPSLKEEHQNRLDPPALSLKALQKQAQKSALTP